MTQVSRTQQWGNAALLRLGAFGFGITGFFMAMDTIVLPSLVLVVAPEGAKNTFLGVLGLGGMVVAGLVQPMVGWYSDRTNTPLGRRVPFILWGCGFVALGLAGLGFISNFSSLFILWVFIQVNASIGYGPFLALIRDLVPVQRMGVASSLKIMADGAGGLVMVAVSGALISRYSGQETIYWLWLTLGAIAGVLVVSGGVRQSYGNFAGKSGPLYIHEEHRIPAPPLGTAPGPRLVPDVPLLDDRSNLRFPDLRPLFLTGRCGSR